MSRIYKILPRAAWELALASGCFEGAGVDLQDGYIHFSTSAQAAETARRYFRNQPDLVVLEVEGDDLGDALKWEPSRGGDLFPHLYAALACEQVSAVHPAPLDDDGFPRLDGLKP
jgi:uncharacterized protein (DUF952 family)